MKTVDDAVFDPTGRFLIALTKGRVARHNLQRDGDNKITTQKTWERHFTHAFHTAIAQRTVVVTNTSGHHIGVDSESGEVVWDRPPRRHRSQEGNPGVVTKSAGLRTVTISPAPNDNSPTTSAFAYVNVASQTITSVRDFGAIRHLSPEPGGSRGLLCKMYAPPGTEMVRWRERSGVWLDRLQLVELPSGTILASRDVSFGSFGHRPTWSPDGSWIGQQRSVRGEGFHWDSAHVLLDAATLETKSEIPHPDPRGLPAFHPDNEHVLLPRGKQALLTRIADLCST